MSTDDKTANKVFKLLN